MNLASFLKLFGYPELKSIGGGRYWKNLGWLTLIYFPALLAIGLGNGTLSYLKKIMDNPFVKFVPVEIPYTGKTVNYQSLKNGIDNPKVKAQFHIDGVQFSGRAYADFLNASQKPVNAYVRSLSADDPFLEFLSDGTQQGLILSQDPQQDLEEKYKNNPWSCIVTEAYLRKLYSTIAPKDWPPVLWHKNPTSEEPIPVAICAVVAELPNFYDMMVSEQLLQAYKQAYNLSSDSPFNLPDHSSYLNILVQEPSSSLETYLKQAGFSEVKGNPTHLENGQVYTFLGTENPESDFKDIRTKFPNDSIWRVYDFDKVGGAPLPVNHEDITIAFNNLDSVASFQAFLLDQYELQVDMNIVKSRENFLLFEKLTNILSYGLTFFGVLAAFLFVVNLIMTHLEKNKKSIGTLKAFGLTNNSIVGLYSLIAFVLLLSVLIISYLIFTFVGTLCLQFILWLWDFDVFGKGATFQLYGLTEMMLLFVVLPAVLIGSQLYFKIRNASPGDLIYERDSR